MATKKPREQRTNNDRELARSLLVGCGIMFGLFLIGSAIIAFAWLQ